MVEIKHALYFVTEVDETHPTGKALLDLSDEIAIKISSYQPRMTSPEISEIIKPIPCDQKQTVLSCEVIELNCFYFV